MTARDVLAGIKARAEKVTDRRIVNGSVAAGALLTDVPRLVAAVEAVLDLHVERVLEGDTHWCEADRMPWPCKTFAAITAALEAT